MGKRFGSARLTMALTCALVLAVGVVPAAAHQVTGSARTYTEERFCVNRASMLTHDASNRKTTASQVNTLTRSWVPISPTDGYWKTCGKNITRPAGWIRTGSALFKRQSDGTYGVCRSAGYAYNNSTASGLFVSSSWGTACGSGTYRTYANGSALWNDAWRGSGNLMSPIHALSS